MPVFGGFPPVNYLFISFDYSSVGITLFGFEGRGFLYVVDGNPLMGLEIINILEAGSPGDGSVCVCDPA